MLRSTFEAMLVEVDELQAGAAVCTHAFMVLVDLDEGMSVTNDIDNVLAELMASGEYKPGRMRLIYRDTQGVYDEVVTNGRGEFVGFRSLGGVRVRELALARAVSMRAVQ